MESFEVQGEWWLPETPARKVAGRLTFNSDDGARLSLIGSLRSADELGTTTTAGTTTTTTIGEDDLDRAGTYARIHGHADNKAYNLEDCFTTYRSGGMFFGGQATETVHANLVLRGALFDVDEGLEATGISANLRYLPAWVARTGLEWVVTDPSKVPGVPVFEIRAHQVPSEGIKLDDGSTLTLHQELKQSAERATRLSVGQNFAWRLDFEHKEPLHTLLDRLGDIQALVSIGVDRAASFERLRLWHPDLERTINGQQVQEPIEFFAVWADDESRRPADDLHSPELVFTFAEIAGMAAVKAWMATAAKYRSALGRVVGGRSRKSMFLGDRLLSYAASLEAFDRDRHGDDTTFATRINRCIALAGQPFDQLVGDTAKWVRHLKNERNDVAHHLGIQAMPTQQQYLVAESAYWLFAYCMLREANAPDPVFDRMQNHQSLRHLARRLSASP